MEHVAKRRNRGDGGNMNARETIIQTAMTTCSEHAEQFRAMNIDAPTYANGQLRSAGYSRLTRDERAEVVMNVRGTPAVSIVVVGDGLERLCDQHRLVQESIAKLEKTVKDREAARQRASDRCQNAIMSARFGRAVQ